MLLNTVPPLSYKCSTGGISREDVANGILRTGRTLGIIYIDLSHSDLVHRLAGDSLIILMMKCSEDEKWVRVAMEEAKRAVGLTSPNPPVGAVIVKDGVELARGRTQKVGGNHAERDALAKLSVGAAKGSTVYVTLEPCSTEGRTGACSSALVEAEVARVVYGIPDPNPNHVGRVDEILEKAGIAVSSGICEAECRHLIRGFTMVQKEGRPWVIAKTAMSLDGRITRPSGEGQWLTGPKARETVHKLRGEVDAIITSGETLRRDDPALTIRSDRVTSKKEQVWRVVVTRKTIEKEDFQMFTDRYRDRSLIFEKVPLYDVIRTLVEDYEVTMVLLEAGGSLLGSFLDEGLIDECVIYLAPMVTGGPSAAIAGQGCANLKGRFSLQNVSIQQVGEDVFARGLIHRGDPRPLER